MTLFKDVVGNIFTEVPKNPKSHVRGWALHWAEMLGDEVEVLSKETPLDGVSTLYFDHGVNSEPGQMNLFGGITDEIVDRLEQIADTPTLSIVSLDAPMPVAAYVDGLTKRMGQASCSPRLTPALIDEFHARLERDRNNWASQRDLVKKTVCIGDSHSTSYARRGQPVIRRNGLTLQHALTKGYFSKVIAGLWPDDLEQVTLVVGSIDIRHHVGLMKDPVERAMEMVEKLVEFADGFPEITFELACPVPVEWEGRRIPKTGWLNGRPFTGSLADRQLWTEVFRQTLLEQASHGKDYLPLYVVSPPQAWYDMDPEAYAKQHMEPASSFHIAPPSYRRHGGWEEL